MGFFQDIFNRWNGVPEVGKEANIDSSGQSFIDMLREYTYSEEPDQQVTTTASTRPYTEINYRPWQVENETTQQPVTTSTGGQWHTIDPNYTREVEEARYRQQREEMLRQYENLRAVPNWNPCITPGWTGLYEKKIPTKDELNKL